MKRNKHSLSHYKLFSANMGILVPCGLVEVLPGDTVQHATSALVRCSPLLAPVMHPVDVCLHHWFVPHRLVWEDFEKFITGGPDGNDASVYPTVTHGGGSGALVGSLADYLGVPPGADGLVTSALPFRGYQRIVNEFYRDQDLDAENAISVASGADSITAMNIAAVRWEKDYFTSARPWEQKGDDVTLPLGTEAPVLGIAKSSANAWDAAANVFTQTDGSQWTGAAVDGDRAAPAMIRQDPNTTTQPRIYADLSSATAASVNAIRQAFALQRFKEMRARYGSRYSEYLRVLGVRSSDARLSRPEYLGGGRQTIQFSEILQTAEGTDPVGDLKGHGMAAMRSNRYRKFFEEHGYVFSLFFVRPKAMYHQGLERHWNRRTKEDFFQPELQHIGQQGILNKEIFAAHQTPEGVFGYQDRYDEYRRQFSTIGGEFRETTLNHWHFARTFAGDPALNGTFVACVPTERVFAVPSQDVLWCMTRHSIQARRLVAQKGTSYIR